MKTTKEMIEVMQGWENGKEIQQKYLSGFDGPYSWTVQAVMSDGAPIWNWLNIDYRIKPEPKVIWVNEFKNGDICLSHSKKEADHICQTNGLSIGPPSKYIEVLEDES